MVQEGIEQITLEPLLPEKADNPRGNSSFCQEMENGMFWKCLIPTQMLGLSSSSIPSRSGEHIFLLSGPNASHRKATASYLFGPQGLSFIGLRIIVRWIEIIFLISLKYIEKIVHSR